MNPVPPISCLLKRQAITGLESRDVVAGQRVVRTHRHGILIRQASAGRSMHVARWRILKILFVSKRKGVVHGNDTVRPAQSRLKFRLLVINLAQALMLRGGTGVVAFLSSSLRDRDP